MFCKRHFSIGPDGATQHANKCWAVPAVSKNHWFSNFLATRCLPERNLQRGAGHQHHPLSLCSSMGRQPFVIIDVYGAVLRKASQAHSPQPGGLRNQNFRKKHMNGNEFPNRAIITGSKQGDGRKGLPERLWPDLTVIVTFSLWCRTRFEPCFDGFPDSFSHNCPQR